MLHVQLVMQCWSCCIVLFIPIGTLSVSRVTCPNLHIISESREAMCTYTCGKLDPQTCQSSEIPWTTGLYSLIRVRVSPTVVALVANVRLNPCSKVVASLRCGTPKLESQARVRPLSTLFLKWWRNFNILWYHMMTWHLSSLSYSWKYFPLHLP